MFLFLIFRKMNWLFILKILFFFFLIKLNEVETKQKYEEIFVEEWLAKIQEKKTTKSRIEQVFLSCSEKRANEASFFQMFFIFFP